VRLTELQRDFVALAAHELRTPATTVYGLAATLAHRELPPEQAAAAAADVCTRRRSG
jgi:signal transduction histidine kinase